MVFGGFLPRDERDARAWNLKFRTRARRFCAFGTEKRYVEIGLKLAFGISCAVAGTAPAGATS